MVGPSKTSLPIVKKKSGDTSIFSIIYSITKKVGTAAAIYLLGYYNLSVAWLVGPIILSAVRDEWKKKSNTRRLLAQAAAVGLTNEKELIAARIDELPAWVYFPDVERAEWLNRIVRQLWPNANHYAKDLLKNVIEPNVRDALKAYKMPGFQFDRMILGTIPVRIGGMKVYDRNVSRNEIIMDIDLFYAGDCDISFILSGFPGGIKDFQIHGMLRVIMKPLIKTIPLVGGLQIFFLNNPSIDFNLVGAIDVLDMPGLSDILRRIIIEQIANLMVLPNKLPIQLSEEVPQQMLKMPEPEGVLRVHVVEAKDLMKMDIGMLGKGKSDPYAIVTVGAQVFRSQIINNSVNPKWDYWCEFAVFESRGQILHIRVFDKDDSKKDEKLGSQRQLCLLKPALEFTVKHGLKQWWKVHNTRTSKVPLEMTENTLVEISIVDEDPMLRDDYCGRATVEISNIAKKGELDVWLALEEVKHGMVHVRMSWHTLTDDPKFLPLAIAETQQLRVTSMSTALLLVYVDSAKNLPDARSRSRPDPSAILSVGKVTKNTRVIYRTDSPVWEEGFTFLVSNPETDTLTIRVKDEKTQNDVGRLEYHLSKLMTLPGHQLDDQPISLLQSGPESKILISLKLRFLKPHESAPTEGENEEEESGESSDKKEPSPPSGLSKQMSKQVSRTDSISSSASATSTSTSSRAPTASVDKDVPVPPSPTDSTGEAFKIQSTPVESQLMQRTTSFTSSAGEAGLGRVQLTLRYSVPRQRLVVVVHKVANLPLKDPSNIPDPYVKLYLLPDRSKETKRKTQVMKDSCNPVYDETFEYVISQGEVHSRTLEITVVTKKTFFLSQNPVMGQVVLALSEIDLSKASTLWFDLQPEKERES